MDLQEKNVLLEKQLSDIRIERDRLVEEGQRLIAELKSVNVVINSESTVLGTRKRVNNDCDWRRN